MGGFRVPDSVLAYVSSLREIALASLGGDRQSDRALALRTESPSNSARARQQQQQAIRGRRQNMFPTTGRVEPASVPRINVPMGSAVSTSVVNPPPAPPSAPAAAPPSVPLTSSAATVTTPPVAPAGTTATTGTTGTGPFTPVGSPVTLQLPGLPPVTVTASQEGQLKFEIPGTQPMVISNSVDGLRSFQAAIERTLPALSGELRTTMQRWGTVMGHAIANFRTLPESPARPPNAMSPALVQTPTSRVPGLLNDVFPMEPQQIADAWRLIVNAANLPRDANGRIANSVYEAAQTAPGGLRAAMLGALDGQSLTPPARVPVPNPAFDPATGPKITMDMITPEMLLQPITSEFLKCVVDPAAFLNMRRAVLDAPTSAQVVNPYDGGRSGLNPAILSSRDESAAMGQIMQRLGVSAATHCPTDSYQWFYVDWGNETRRDNTFSTGQNVGLLRRWFASNTFEVAMNMVQTETASLLRGAGR